MSEEYLEEYAQLNVRRIRLAWLRLKMPDLTNWRPVYEHNRWWVQGHDEEPDMRTFSVELGEGPGTHDGICFEEV